MSVHLNANLIFEVLLRVFLWFLFLYFDQTEPFIRVIQPEELWFYHYPFTTSYVSAQTLWIIISILPSTCIITEYLRKKDEIELKNAFLSLTLTYCLNGFLTSFFKVIVGRPRPDFFFRCFPDGRGSDLTHCTGNPELIIDGRKSFPSGHSSFAFSCMVFTTLYLARKLQVTKRNDSWRLCVCILPLVSAAVIAISRTCDYHHHWEDVLAGSLLGTILAYVCYIQYLPLADPQAKGYLAMNPDVA